jgi:hypothetical protein
MARLSDEQKARLRAQRERLDAVNFVSVEPGQLWAVSSDIRDANGELVEQSWAPVAIAILSRLDEETFDAAPLSYDVDLAGPGDIRPSGTTLFERPFMIETWLRMPVRRDNLHRGVGRLDAASLDAANAAGRASIGANEADFDPDDPRTAYRIDEHTRVLFVLAGMMPATPERRAALAHKRDTPRWQITRPRAEAGPTGSQQPVGMKVASSD